VNEDWENPFLIDELERLDCEVEAAWVRSLTERRGRSWRSRLLGFVSSMCLRVRGLIKRGEG